MSFVETVQRSDVTDTIAEQPHNTEQVGPCIHVLRLIIINTSCTLQYYRQACHHAANVPAAHMSQL